MFRFVPLAYLPNCITLGRIVLVPVVLVLIINHQWDWAFAAFIIAGASDGLDGYLARRFDLRSELGAYLDACADKALLMSIYLALSMEVIVPLWLAIMVIFRDVMIMSGIIVAWLMGRPIPINPLKISKLNTTVQICFAASVLAAKAFDVGLGPWLMPALWVTALLTMVSAAAYLFAWLRYMSVDEAA